jgi:hypothetical protein
LLVLPEAAFKVFGVTDVIGSVATAENIDQNCMSGALSPFDFAQDERILSNA